MNRLRICTVLGTRPEAIKLAPVIQCLDRQPGIEQRVLVTGQHRDLLDPMLMLFRIHPARDLRVMEKDHRLGALMARVVEGVEEDLARNQPEWVLVQGDTTSALAAALAAYYCRIPVAHVEAGLRTYDPFHPFPEEIHRQFVDHLAQLHFAPTERARQNLLREGIDAATVHVTGNTGIDALFEMANRDGALPARTDENGRRLLLVTAHRRESFGPELLNVCLALRTVVLRNPDVDLVYAVHPNPNVEGTVRRELNGLPRLRLTTFLDYLEFVRLMKRSFLILTDSGGIQEEAASLGKPVLVLRARTERLEGVEWGGAKLIGTDPDRIVVETEQLLHNSALYAQAAQIRPLYGDGRAAERIVKVLVDCDTAMPRERAAMASVGQGMI